ncbi:MAG TPA: hypothetical protein VEU96_33045 [Bryobacteraceae bacterium]|nr:hypothetical protein [Bryobacteraceae bacterium]
MPPRRTPWWHCDQNSALGASTSSDVSMMATALQLFVVLAQLDFLFGGGS